MAGDIDYPDDPLRTFSTNDPYVRRVEFGDPGLITYLIMMVPTSSSLSTSPGPTSNPMNGGTGSNTKLTR